MENYFPRPRAYCLMSEIARNIDSDLLPLSQKLSKKIISKLDKKSQYPKIYRYTKKIRK